MANIPVSTDINSLLTAATGTPSKDALGVLGAVKKGTGDIVAADIAAGAVIEAKILDGAVTAGKIGANAVTTIKIADDNVTTAKIVDGAVTVAKTTGVQASLVSGTNIRSVNGTTLLGSGDLAVTGSDVINVTASPYNAVADGKLGEYGVMTSGSSTLTSSTANFPTSGLVGNFIRVVGAGVAGADLVTTIASRTSSTVLVLNAAAGTTVSVAQFFYGTDNTSAINLAILAANNSTTTKTVLIPAGIFLGNYLGYPHVKIVGAGGFIGQSAITASGLANITKQTVLLAAVSTIAVIRYRSANGGCAGVRIENIVFIGGNGTNTANRFGHGIEFGNPSNVNSSAEGAGFKLSACEINGFYRGVTMSSVWDSAIELCQFNFCKQGVFGGEIDLATNIESDTGPADGITITSCGSNFTDIVFDFRGSKSIAIICGDYNSFLKFVRSSGSKIFVSGINLEAGGIADVLFHLYDNSAPSTLDVGSVLLINSRTSPATDSIWSEHASGGNISWKFGGFSTLKTITNDIYPLLLPTGGTIQRCTDTTWATIYRTEKTSKIYRVSTSNDVQISEDFARLTSPYGTLGWIGTAIAGAAAQYTNQDNAFKIYIDSTPTKSIRFAPAYGFTDFNGDWTFSMFVSVSDTSTTIFRCGLYSIDTSSPTLTPANGIGIRMDTSSPNSDTTVKLEIIIAGLSSVVDTTITLAAMNNANTEIILERRSNTIFAYLRNINKARLAPEVSYASNLPNTYCAPAILMGGTSGGRQTLFRSFKFQKFT